MQPPKPAPAPPASDWPLRVLTLVPLAALVLLWTNHHFGAGLGYPKVMAALAAALPVAFGLVAKLLDDADQKTLAGRSRAFLSGLLTWPRLFILYLALGIVSLTWTSIVILPESGLTLGKATLIDLDDPAATTPLIDAALDKDSGRTVVATGPFGRAFRLSIEGYVPQTVEAYPLIGLRVRPSRDLRRSPSFLLRLSKLAEGSWRDVKGATLRVTAKMPDSSDAVIFQSTTPAAALLVGREQAIPLAWNDHWRLELLAAGVRDDGLIASHIVGWRKPFGFKPESSLQPGVTVLATLVNPQQQEIARREFVLGSDDLQDIRMEDLP
jgi:hypothetical protein